MWLAQANPADWADLVKVVGIPGALLLIFVALYARGVIPSPSTVTAMSEHIEFLKSENASEKAARTDDRRRDLERADKQYTQMEAFLQTAVTMTHTVTEAKNAVDASAILQRDSLEALRGLQKASDQLAREIVELRQQQTVLTQVIQRTDGRP